MIMLNKTPSLSCPRLGKASTELARMAGAVRRLRPALMLSSGVALMASLAVPAAAQFPAQAATVDSSIGVSSTVEATCVTTATPLAFGTYTGVQADGTATVTITCTASTPYVVGLNAGLGTGALITDRSMLNGAIELNYGLFSDAARSTNWGDTEPTGAVAGIATGAAQVLTVYGRELAGQYVEPGVYTDTITATVTY